MNRIALATITGLVLGIALVFGNFGDMLIVALFGAIIVWMLILLSHLSFRQTHKAADLPTRGEDLCQDVITRYALQFLP